MTGNCSVCPKADTRLRRGWCSACYKSWRTHGDPRHRLTARKRPWTERERSTVLYELGYTSIPKIAKSLHRSPIAILREAQRRQLSVQRMAARTHGMNAADVMEALGVTRGVVFRWVMKGWLKAHVVTLYRRKVISIDPDDVTAFLRERGALFTLRPTPAWTPLVADARDAVARRYISFNALVQALAIEKSNLYVWRRKEAFPPAVAGPFGARWYDRAAVAEWVQTHRPHYWTTAVREALHG